MRKVELQETIIQTCYMHGLCVMTKYETRLHVGRMPAGGLGGARVFSRDVVLGGKLLLWGEKM